MPPLTTTTASNAVTYTTEADLIGRVQVAKDSDALTALASQHTGIYLSVVNRYASAYPNTIRREDLADDKLFNIYRFILDYDPAKGTKLCTYIGNRTDWMCKTLLKQDTLNPVRSGTYGPSGAMCIQGDSYTTERGTSVVLADESSDADVIDIADKDLQIEDVLAAAQSLCPDSRFAAILTYRHFQLNGQTCLSWRQIGERLNLSHEACRKIYWHNLGIVREHLRGHTV